MSALQTINLGTAPTGSDGDPVRTAFTKDNANVAVLQTQETLTSVALITSAQALTTAHIGKRVNINLSSTGTINLPAASTCLVDQVTLLRNLGSTIVTLAVTSASGDTLTVSKLNPGESALFDTDGIHTWNCLLRGRTSSDNETVNGTCAVVGNETVGGTLGVTGNTTLSGTLGVTGNTTLSGTLGVTSAAAFTVRPSFNSNTPWDSGNLAAPATLNTAQTVTAVKTFTAAIMATSSALFSGGSGTANQQGLTLAWNTASVGSGSADIVCNEGFGGGGFVLRTVNATNSSEIGRFVISGAGVGTNGSDRRFKKRIRDIPNSLARVRALHGVSYKYRANGEQHYGLIAQDVSRYFPHAVSVHSEVEGVKYFGLSYTDLIAPLIESVKELADGLDAARDEIARLKLAVK